MIARSDGWPAAIAEVPCGQHLRKASMIEGLAADDRLKGFITPARIPGTCDCSAFRPGFHRQPTVLRRAAMKELEDEQEWLPRSGTSAPRAVFVPQHASRCLETPTIAALSRSANADHDRVSSEYRTFGTSGQKSSMAKVPRHSFGDQAGRLPFSTVLTGPLAVGRRLGTSSSGGLGVIQQSRSRPLSTFRKCDKYSASRHLLGSCEAASPEMCNHAAAPAIDSLHILA